MESEKKGPTANERHRVLLWAELPWFLSIPEGRYEIAGFGPNSLHVVQRVTKCTLMDKDGVGPEVHFIHDVSDAKIEELKGTEKNLVVSRELCRTILYFENYTDMTQEEAERESTARLFVNIFFALANKLLAAYVAQSSFSLSTGYVSILSAWTVRHMIISITPEEGGSGFQKALVDYTLPFELIPSLRDDGRSALLTLS